VGDGDNQTYRINAKLRRRGEAALDQNRTELKSEDFDNDHEFCQAVASDLYEILQADRDYLNSLEGDENE
jgi:hypothetical protein